jgi:hypothetical protein
MRTPASFTSTRGNLCAQPDVAALREFGLQPFPVGARELAHANPGVPFGHFDFFDLEVDHGEDFAGIRKTLFHWGSFGWNEKRGPRGPRSCDDYASV